MAEKFNRQNSITVIDPVAYDKPRSGTAEKVIIVDASAFTIGQAISKEAILGKMLSFQWQEPYDVQPLMELNRDAVFETIDGAMGMGNCSCQTWETFKSGNNLPSSLYRPEMIIFEMEGDFETYSGTILNVFIGVKVVNQGKSVSGSGGARMRNASFTYRRRLTGAEYLFNYAKADSSGPFSVQ